MKKLLYFLALSFLTATTLPAQEKGVTTNIPEIEVEATEPIELFKAPKTEVSKKTMVPKTLSMDYDKPWRIVPPQRAYVLKINSQNESLEEINFPFNLLQESKIAIKLTPKWLRPALCDNLRRLSVYIQQKYANLIINTPWYKRDEVAFAVAHLAPQTLSGMEEEILDVNAHYIYKVDPLLQYVDLAEYGSEENEDWHTTTKYRVLQDGDSVWVEIPRDIYYWWIVMPKLTDERPSMGRDVYDEFWRQHLWENADEGFPVLKKVLKNTKIMWDCQEHKWRNEDQDDNKYDFADSLFAIQVVGRWTAHTIEKKNNDQLRPVQPNVILHHHNGNCGENQDLMNAGCRTALLPVSSVGSHPGDHVWNELYWDDEWWYLQIDWDCGPTRLNQSKSYPKKGLITGWRGDVYRWQVNDRYNDVCNLNLSVVDSNGAPVDGAEVTLFSASHKDPTAEELYLGATSYADTDGILRTNLGLGITYGFRVDAQVGHVPKKSNHIQSILADSLPEENGATINAKVVMPLEMPKEPEATDIEHTGGELYKVSIDYETPYRILYGGGYWQANYYFDDFEWHDFREGGEINFYVCDTSNYELYRQGEPFEAYEVITKSTEGNLEFYLPEEEDYYLIFSNRDYLNTSQFVQCGVNFYKNESGNWNLIDSLEMKSILDVEELAETDSPVELRVSPNPSSSVINVSFNCESNRYVELCVYDLSGKRVKTLFRGDAKGGENAFKWNRSSRNGELINAGTYIIVLNYGNGITSRKAVVIE